MVSDHLANDKRTVASYFQVSLVRNYRVHRRSSGGSVLIVRVYVGRIFRLEIAKVPLVIALIALKEAIG